jgi:hypothetical protein
MAQRRYQQLDTRMIDRLCAIKSLHQKPVLGDEPCDSEMCRGNEYWPKERAMKEGAGWIVGQEGLVIRRGRVWYGGGGFEEASERLG